MFGSGTTNGSSLFGSKPAGGSLFGDKPPGSLFSNGNNSLFGNQSSIFSKPAEKKDGEEENQGDENELYKNDDELPTIALEDKEAEKSPFTKVFEKDVQKFKQATPAAEKKNFGVGKVSI